MGRKYRGFRGLSGRRPRVWRGSPGKNDASDLLVQVGAAIRRERKAQGMSQEALAYAAGIDRSHMGKIERGERNLSLLNITRIAAALRMMPSELLARASQ